MEATETLNKPASPIGLTAGYLVLLFALAIAGNALWRDSVYDFYHNLVEHYDRSDAFFAGRFDRIGLYSYFCRLTAFAPLYAIVYQLAVVKLRNRGKRINAHVHQHFVPDPPKHIRCDWGMNVRLVKRIRVRTVSAGSTEPSSLPMTVSPVPARLIFPSPITVTP